MNMIKYNKYSSYKDSGVHWLEEIPEHWEILPSKRFHYVKKQINYRRECENVLSLTLRGVVNNDPDSPEGMVPKDYCTYQIFEENNLVFKLIDLENIRTSRVGIVHEKGIMSSAYIRLIVGKENYPRYTYYYFYCLYINEVYNNLGSGVRSTLGPNDLLSIPYIKPTLSEQTAIALFLDRKTALIEQAIDIKQKQIELLKERRQILIHNAVTRGLNPDVKMKNSGVEWIGEIPEHWNVTSIKHILEMPICDGPHTTPQLFDEGIPFISAEAIKNGEIDFGRIRGYISIKDHMQFCKKYSPKRYDIYMVKSGATTGNVAMVKSDIEFSIWSPLAVFRANQSEVIPNYLYNCLESPSFKIGVELSWSFGTQQNIGMGILSNLPIAYPNIQEQIIITEFIGRVTDKILSAISLKQQEIDKLREYKSTLINSTVTGKIKVS